MAMTERKQEEMDLPALCGQIGLPDDVKAAVLDFAAGFDFGKVEVLLRDFRQYSKMKEARTRLQALLEPDGDHLKMLACMLKGSADAYGFYREKGISGQIYLDTMRCYTRFMAESRKSTGRICFDRSWWTSRQVGGHLFRIGRLEYEIVPDGKGAAVELHIPSDGDFSPREVDRSLELAEGFFREHYPELVRAEYRCHSWLLDGQLGGMLDEGSNIRHFQTRFEILDRGGVDAEFIEWLFQTKSTNISTLPEDTSLQRNVKRHLLSGGQIYTAFGRLMK